MDTIPLFELDLMDQRKYLIKKIDASDHYYYSLIRRRDDAILYSNPDIKNVEIECWKKGIDKKDVIYVN